MELTAPIPLLALIELCHKVVRKEKIMVKIIVNGIYPLVVAKTKYFADLAKPWADLHTTLFIRLISPFLLNFSF